MPIIVCVLCTQVVHLNCQSNTGFSHILEYPQVFASAPIMDRPSSVPSAGDADPDEEAKSSIVALRSEDLLSTTSSSRPESARHSSSDSSHRRASSLPPRSYTSITDDPKLHFLDNPTERDKRRVSNHTLSLGSTAPNTSPFKDRQKSTDLNAETIRQLRHFRAASKRYDRTALHVDNFIRLYVNPPGGNHPFMVVVDKRATVEYLSHLIEAEWALKYCMPHKLDKAAISEEPLACGMLYDANQVSLRFSDKIGDVLDADSDIFPTNVLDSQVYTSIISALSGEPSRKAVSNVGSQDNVAQEPPNVLVNDDIVPANNNDNVLELLEGNKDDTTASPRENNSTILRQASIGASISSSVKRSMPLHERVQEVLRNKIALEFFHEFCIEEYVIENLLFWLDVEIFQSCPNEFQSAYAKYIYLLYIARGAPLQLNLTDEVRDEVPRPPEDNSQAWPADSMIFDEAQEQVYSNLKAYTFERFERSLKWSEMHTQRRADRAAFAKENVSDSYFEMFKPDMTRINQTVDSLERFGEEGGTGSDSNLAAPTNLRDKMLCQAIEGFFPSSKYYSLDGYFNESCNRTGVHKRRKIHKEKKLAKFFGERPTIDQLQRQICSAALIRLQMAQVNLSAESLGPEGASPAESVTLERMHGMNSALGTDLFSKKRKLEKLQDFFGDKLSVMDIEAQRQGKDGMFSHAFSPIDSRRNSTSTSNPDLALPPATLNELSSEAKMLLTKRSKKISSMLGTHVNEQLAQQALTKPHIKLIGSKEDIRVGVVLELSNSGEVGAGSDHKQRRRWSMSSLESLNSTTHSVAAESAADKDSREYRRRKLAKLQHFLGERLTLEEVATPVMVPVSPRMGPLTQEAKASQLKRADKLNRMFGEVVPAKMVSVDRDSVLDLQKQIQVLQSLMESDKDVLELIDAMTDFDMAMSGVKDPEFGSDEELQKQKASMQQKMKRLRKFFGTNVDTGVVLEQILVADLERSIDEGEITQKEKEALKESVTLLRNSIRGRKITFNNAQ
ncbi:hypothetical protein BJ742DRAFT_818158 [Cladochytrium replicatum]|nr:hypothetical protein BJ742DRAFT_818158 [Cladochytrium replicatum]